MTRAEKAGLEAYPENISYSTLYDTMKDYNTGKRKVFVEGYEQGYKEAVEKTCKWLEKEFKAWNRISVEVMTDEYYEEIMGETTMMDTYEQKYKEALERARKCLDKKRDTCFVRPDVIFPELAESKDEKIRKTIIRFFKDQYSNETEMYDGTVTVGDVIAWLEKQGEQKSVLDELEMTLSVSEDGYLRSNLEKLIRELKG